MIAGYQTDQRRCRDPITVSDGLFTHLGSRVKGCPARHGKSHSDIRDQIAISILHGSAHGIGGDIVRHRATGDGEVSTRNNGCRLIGDKGRGFRRSGMGAHRCRHRMITRHPTDQ
ncbi:Uncharacterised protein [Yersinia intermedia]|uniref:Uncharacterized protein n=1 Tax=Yersinia intermedia TaxID=631 RepID=A0A0H5M2L7_YERIN|nr:Uncharacterised protein [Yersinia intermedia]